MKKIFIIFLVFVFFNSFIYLSFADYDINSLSTLNSRSCIVFDRNSQMVLYGKNEQQKVKMASTTKIMTAIVVIENSDMNDIVQVSKKSASTGGSRLGLRTNDKISISDLLYGLMLVSGNDAAVCLAEYVGGDIPGFASLMNNKAHELGLNNTHYESPHGLDSDGHYTSAFDLAKLSDYALKNPIFSKIVGTKNYTVNINGHFKNLTNTNELLGSLNGVYGVKTGFTNGANRCLVTSCKRNDMDIICVVLGADTKKFRTNDSIKLIEYAFKNFEYINANELATNYFNTWKIANLKNINFFKSSCDNLELSLELLENPIISINRNDSNNFSYDIFINTNLEAPISANTVLGSLYVNLDDKNIVSLNIVSKIDINRKDIFYYLKYFFNNYTNILEHIVC